MDTMNIQKYIMAHQTEVLLLIIILATTDYALGVTQTPKVQRFDRIVKAAAKQASSICPFGWVYYGGRCFIYQAAHMDWASAENYCMQIGGHLVSIHNSNDQQLVRALIRAHDTKEDLTWIGLSGCEKKWNFFWSDGTKYDYSKWAPKEPNNQQGECCVHTNFKGSKAWNDYPCDRTIAFVCAKRSA